MVRTEAVQFPGDLELVVNRSAYPLHLSSVPKGGVIQVHHTQVCRFFRSGGHTGRLHAVGVVHFMRGQ